MATRTKKTSINFIVGIIYQFIFLFSQFILRSIIINKLGEEYLGLSSVITSILNVLNITELGFANAIVFSLYKPLADNDVSKTRALLHYIRKVYRIIGLIILSIGLIITPFLSLFINKDVPTDVSIYLVFLIYLFNTVISYMLFSYKRSILVADQKNYMVKLISSISLLIQTTIQLILIFTIKNFYIYILIFPCITILNNICISVITNKKYKNFFIKEELDEETKKDLKTKIAGLFIFKLTATSRTSFDSIFISAFLGLTLVAIHSNYYYIITGIATFLTVITQAMSASVGNKVAVSSIEDNYNDFKKFDFLFMLISGWCAVMLLVLFQPFMSLWVGEELMLPFYTMCIFVVYFYANRMGSMRALYNDAKGLWWEQRYRTIVEAILNIILNLVLVLLFGIFGIMLASVLTIIFLGYGLSATITFKNYFGSDKLKSYYLSHLKYIVVTVFICVTTLWVCSYISLSNSLVELIIKFLCAGLLSFVLYMCFYFRNTYFKQNFNFFKRIIKK